MTQCHRSRWRLAGRHQRRAWGSFESWSCPKPTIQSLYSLPGQVKHHPKLRLIQSLNFLSRKCSIVRPSAASIHWIVSLARSPLQDGSRTGCTQLILTRRSKGTHLGAVGGGWRVLHCSGWQKSWTWIQALKNAIQIAWALASPSFYSRLRASTSLTSYGSSSRNEWRLFVQW